MKFSTDITTLLYLKCNDIKVSSEYDHHPQPSCAIPDALYFGMQLYLYLLSFLIKLLCTFSTFSDVSVFRAKSGGLFKKYTFKALNKFRVELVYGGVFFQEVHGLRFLFPMQNCLL